MDPAFHGDKFEIIVSTTIIRLVLAIRERKYDGIKIISEKIIQYIFLAPMWHLTSHYKENSIRPDWYDIHAKIAICKCIFEEQYHVAAPMLRTYIVQQLYQNTICMVYYFLHIYSAPFDKFWRDMYIYTCMSRAKCIWKPHHGRRLLQTAAILNTCVDLWYDSRT